MERLEWRTIDQRPDGTRVMMPAYTIEPDEPEPQEECGCCCHDEAGRCHQCLQPKS